ncbi:MAG TPA: Ig-like domain-containing protein [Accumulibacter sp.]|nr:Ig-like domain-containing protein [Accumulibacter sp.]
MQGERLGSEAGAAQVWRPSFSGDRGWTLQAHADEARSGADRLQRQGDRLYAQDSGLPWVPRAYTLTAPDGTRYTLDAQGTINGIAFADGQSWLVSDAGIAAVNGDFAERVDFQRDSAGHIVRLTAPDGAGGTTAIAYRYDSAGRLILVRRLDDGDPGTPIAYAAGGQVLTDPLTAYLGAAVRWGSSDTNAWAGELNADTGINLAFSVRESEIESTIHAPGAQGAVILALETMLPADARLEVVGAQTIGSTTVNGTHTRLLRVSEAGVKLIRISGNGAAQLRISVAGDLDRDGRIDAADSQAWEQAASAQDRVADINGDGRMDSADRQVLYANYGFRANRAPTAANTANGASAVLNTHTDLATRGALSKFAEDLEGDTLFWRVLGSSHGSGRIEADGQTLSFTPEAGYSGAATLTLQADDGFAAGAPLELTIDVSGASLLRLHLAQLPARASGQFARLQASADFADEQSVAITDAAYLTLGSADLTELGGRLPNPLQVDDTHDIVRATGVGPALLMIQRVDNDGRLVQAAAAINVRAAALPFDREAGAEENESASGYGGDESLSIEPDVYPGTLTLMPGDTRQLKVRLPDPYSDQPIDIHTASQTNFSGAPETLERYLDPESGESFDIVIPATPPVYSGTRYVVSDASIASLGEDGLITALRPGEVSVAIVHLASVVDRYGGVSDQVIGQSTIRLRVQAAALTDDDPNTAAPAGITIAADQGGVVQAATGETVMIGAGALRDDALVSIRHIAVAELLAETGMSAPAPEVLQTLAAFRLDLGEQASSVPVQLAIPLQAEVGVEVGDEVLFLRRGTAPDVNGILQDKWWLLDNGFVGTDAQGRLVARTASPPYGGVSASGDLVVVKTRSNHETGALTVRGNGVNVFALTTNSLAISLAGNLANGGLTGAGAATNLIGMFAGTSEIYAINLDFGGVYQVVPVQRSLDNGELTLTIATPGESGSGTRDTGTSPRITDVKMLAAGKLQLTVEDLQPAAVPGMAAQASALRVWISPDEPKVDPYGKASSAVWRNDSQEMRDGMRLWQKVVDLAAVAPGAARMTVDIDLPPQLALGLHVITVQRMLQSVDPANPGATRWLANGEAGHVALAGQTDFSVVTLANRMQIFRNGEIVKEIPYLDANGDPTVGGGSKTDQIAFSLDNRLVFVAGAHGTIHVIDTATMSATTSFSVGTANVSSLAVSGQWLYVAEGGPYDPAGNYRLLRVNIDETASDFLAIRQVELPAAVSGQNAPYGYIDMALTHGAHSYLALTASRQSIDVAMARSQPDSGNVFILDLDQLQERSGRLAATGAGAFVQVDFPTREGKGPQYIASAGIKGNTLRLLLSDALDDNAGLATITVELSNSGRLQGAPVFRQIPMSGALPGMSRLDGNYQLNIQRAQSPAVIVARNGSEYALVADYFFDFVDPLYALDDPQTGARQAGGKIGIVKNPFAAAPEYLGATSPIIDANFSRLQVTDGGRTLWADIRYWPTIGEAPPASGLLVWDLDALIAAAERNSLARQASPRPLPIDRQRIDGVTTQVVTPSKLNLADSPQLTSGWIHGMATSQLLQPDAVEFTAPVDGGQFLRTTIAPDAGGKVPEINYGDVARVDLFKLIRDEYASTLADLNDADFNINWENIEVGGAAQLVRDGQGFLLTAEREDGFTSAQAATNATYSGLQAVGTDLGKKTLRDSGIVFLAPKIDVDRLRQGRTLPSADITLSLKGYDRNDPEKRLLLRLRVVDYTRAAETVFFGDRPLNNPGYHPFAGAAGLSARPGAENDLLDVWRVEQRLKYLGFGVSAMNTGEITVNGTIDDAEHIALRQFDQIIDGKTAYATTLTEQITVGGRARTRTTPLPPVTLSEHDVAWLNAYNAPHWLDFFPSGSQQLVGWEDMTDKTNPTAAMGTSWVFDLMVAGQAENNTLEGEKRPNLWFAGTNNLGNRLNLGVRTDYVSTQNQRTVSGSEVINGVIPRTPPPAITHPEAYTNREWDYVNSRDLSPLLLNPHLRNFDPSTRTFGENPSNGTPESTQLNKQNEVLLDFVAIYAATQTNGTRESIRILNGDTETIRTALFGDGNPAGGIIDQQALLIGGTALSIGSQMTAESLGNIMGNVRGVNYGDWIAPLQSAMLEFEITTPQRIAAFLAQIKQESGGMRDLTEGFNYSQAALASTFSYLRTHQEVDAAGSTRTLAQLLGRQAGEATVPHDRQVRIANTVYGSESNAYLGNGNIASGDGWLFKGRGLKQITGRANYGAFAAYLSSHPLAGQPTGAELMRNPDLLASNRELAARSAGWFWAIGSSASNLNGRADLLNFSKSNAEKETFDEISTGIGRMAHAERWLKYKRNVDLMQTGGNPYENLRKALSQLGFSSRGEEHYDRQFGIILRPPALQAVTTPMARSLNAILGTDLFSRQTDNINLIFSRALTTEIQEVGDRVQVEPYFYRGVYKMVALDYMDHSGSTSPIVSIAQAEASRNSRQKKSREMGICHVVPNIPLKNIHTESGVYPEQIPVFPYFEASLYFTQFEGRDIRKWYANTGPFDRSKTNIIKTPAHGSLLPAKCEEHRAYCEHKAFYYKPDDGYFGDDSAIIDAEVNGWKVRLYYQFHSMNTAAYTASEVCSSSDGYRIWKISKSPTAVNDKDIVAWHESVPLAGGVSSANVALVTYLDLPGGTLGKMTVDQDNVRIALDPTAAGYGWFVDLTPSDNAEFLPTSNPFELIARPGSDAEGRMDLLTVLRHEYGHAAGLEHSGDSHDLMASTLLPGVRRLPTSSELAALHGLLAGTNSAPLPYDPSTPPGAPLPLSRSVGSLRLSRLRPAETNDPAGDTLSAAIAQFSIAANPTLLDAGFIDGSAWSTSGEVVFTQGAATLREAASSQTRLNQAFVVGANDGTLSFTLADIALDDVDAAPDDAFEVALIDASTGQSLMGGSGLANSDAIFNLQADGSEHRAAGVTTLHNADGGVSVVVDLTGIAPGTVVNLSFDLIGFGRGAAAVSSQVTVRDLRLGGGQALAARDDEATTAEDTPLRIAVLDNDSGVQSGDEIGSETSGIVPVLVDGPLHGKVAVNGDGSFTYSPQADWNGTDRFAYRLLGKEVESNIATVRVIVTPVNDAPTLSAGGLQATYADEDFTLELRSSDPDDDRINGWQIDWGDGQIVDIDGNPGQVSHRYSGVLGEVLIRATAVDDDGRYALDPLAVTILPPPLQVTSFSYDHGGFTVRFNDVFEAGRINLYDSALTGLGAADIVLIGSAGVVSGSLVVDADYRGLRYLVGGNGLLADTYRLTLRSGPQAFHSAWSDLDGNGDGDIVPGDDFRTSFTLDAVPATQLALPDFMRGPGQAVNVPAAGQHLPLTLLSPGEVRQLSFVIRFDPALLEISAALPGSGLPADAVLKIDRPLRGELRVNIETATAIAAGTVTLLDLVASVPATAPYGTQQVLDIQQVSINAQSLSGADRDGLQSVGYVGDTNGNGTWEKADLALISRLALQADNGFAAWSRIDPLLVADVDSDHRITSADVSTIGQTLHDLQWPQGAKAPTGLSLTFAEPQAWPGQPQIDFGAPFAGFTFGSDDPRYRRDNWKLSFVTQLAGKTVNPNSRLQVTLDSSPQATRSA